MAGTYSLDGIKRAAIVSSGTNASSKIQVPRNADTLTIHAPASFAGSQWFIQTLVPMADPESEVWNETYCYDPVNNAIVQLIFPAAANAAYVLPNGMFGGGTIRINTIDNQVADATFTCVFTGFNN